MRDRRLSVADGEARGNGVEGRRDFARRRFRFESAHRARRREQRLIRKNSQTADVVGRAEDFGADRIEDARLSRIQRKFERARRRIRLLAAEKLHFHVRCRVAAIRDPDRRRKRPAIGGAAVSRDRDVQISRGIGGARRFYNQREVHSRHDPPHHHEGTTSRQNDRRPAVPPRRRRNCRSCAPH